MCCVDICSVTHYNTVHGVTHYNTVHSVTHYNTVHGVTHYNTVHSVTHYNIVHSLTHYNIVHSVTHYNIVHSLTASGPAPLKCALPPRLERSIYSNRTVKYSSYSSQPVQIVLCQLI